MRTLAKGIPFLLLATLLACSHGQKSPLAYVDPFIGTGAHGHTYPGPSMPFGMVQLSPDTRLDNTWDGCGGYHYSDSSIIGFSHTHLSGTGVSDYGDVLLMPFTGETEWQPGKRGYADSGYRSRFSHQSETATAGYYSVLLSDDSIQAELTVTPRVGMHRYSYLKSQEAQILIDLTHRDPLMSANLKQISDTEIEGYRISKLWAGEQHVYFVAQFSEPIQNIEYKSAQAEQFTINQPSGFQKAVIQFGNKKQITVKVALSAVSCEGARKNLTTEVAHWDFNKVRQNAESTWNSELKKIEVEGGTEEQKRNFYTAFYHCMLTPNLYSDVDGKYRGMDMKIHEDSGFAHYTVFSLWDTFRGLHPLLTLTHPKESRAFCNSLIRKAEQFGEIPMWELASNDTRCMIGYHGVSVLADAILKGLGNIDTERAYAAMTASANVNKRGINFYRELGFVPYNRSSQAVSKTLEYAYNDWCIAQIAQLLNKTEDYQQYMARAQFYQNLYNRETGFMRPRNDKHQWEADFDPMRIGFSFTEGNSFQYSLFVPHDVEGLKALIGGSEAFENWLDKLFTTEIDHELEEGTDVTGLIGNYAHGNEPSHHLAYMYNYTANPWKTQQRTHQILDEMYKDTPGGLCGNEDCGQMSAWYVMSAMGFYSLCPGNNTYPITSPLFDKVTINTDSGKPFVIESNRESASQQYIASINLNGKEYKANYITHSHLTAGGKMLIGMTADTLKAFRFTLSDQQKNAAYAEMPWTSNGQQNFSTSQRINLQCSTPNANIFYTTDGSEPTQVSKKYENPIVINQSTTLKARAYADGFEPSATMTRKQVKPEPENLSQMAPGLKYRTYNGIYRSVYDWVNDSCVAQGIHPAFNLDCRRRDEWYGIHFDGYINIPSDDTYTFTVLANDGGQMRIDGEELFESDGRKSHSLMQGYTLEMKKGLHRIEVKYYQCSDERELTVMWESKKMKQQVIKPEFLFHKKRTSR